MGSATVDEVLLSTGNEKSFLTLIYDYIMGLFEGVTCKITIGDTVIDPATPNDMQWNNRTKTNIDFTLKPGVILRFQVYMNASSGGDVGRNTSYNIFFIINGIPVGHIGNDGGDTYHRSGLVFDDSVDYPKYSANHRRRYLVSKYISDNIFAIWFGNCSRTTWINSDFFIIGIKDTSDEWHYAGGSNDINNINFYDSDGTNPATLSPMFSYEARTGYLDFISHSSFVSGSTKVFTSNDVYDCTTVNFGDTLSLKDGANFLAIGAHSMVILDD